MLNPFTIKTSIMRVYTVKKPFNLSDLDTHTSVEHSEIREQCGSLL